MPSPLARVLSSGRTSRGSTLMELMIAIVVVGVLAAVAIPAFSTYKKRAYLSEGTANIQGIMEAMQAHFVRFQRYLPALPLCPPAPPANIGQKQLFNLALCSADWRTLGWTPDDAVAFQYRTFSAYNAVGARVFHPVSAAPPGMLCPGGKCYGLDWSTEVSANLAVMQPWVVVEAVGDTDKDGAQVFIRTNNINNRTFITPDDTY
ncbi:MAG TPA: prepilin-type N-terminal cleavage/methylation domain-containing protein [Myxococcota bacterium]|nr:prepilin-type N-terminal cleavage/methylation domain-containing protein [Myxococcota bacterium]HRY95112.1 prepilin-type N-terminal cleavage/methylation domain-containing protein [Myxococcota bacterium]HSA21144.1 prepilin-type N-terminal cleavage/methylation domain-containing protein [Myxococcota bacterium]